MSPKESALTPQERAELRMLRDHYAAMQLSHYNPFFCVSQFGERLAPWCPATSQFSASSSSGLVNGCPEKKREVKGEGKEERKKERGKRREGKGEWRKKESGKKGGEGGKKGQN